MKEKFKYCYRCKKNKNIKDFYKDKTEKTGRCSICSECVNADIFEIIKLKTKDYPKEWTKELKEDIKKRDNYTCQNCGRTEKENFKKYKKKLSVHHIDMDKDNCEPNNLISLCTSCHMKIHTLILHTNYFPFLKTP